MKYSMLKNVSYCKLIMHQHSCRKNIFKGSCTVLEFKASLEKSLNFRKLKKFLNCLGKRLEGLEKFGICLS